MHGLMLLAAMALVGVAPPGTAPLLTERDLDPALVLPPPPIEGSGVQRDELAGLHRLDAARTSEELARARDDDRVKDASIFAEAIGSGFDLARLPATKALLATVRSEEKAAADRAKKHFRRPRPWIVDASLHPCSTDDEPLSSYPSGHTTMGYAMAAVLARLVPARAPAILDRAAAYARSRLVCEIHFPSDVAAGQSYGLVVAERLMENPEFSKRFAAAHAELIRAGIGS